jgi:2-C-methyl-D-erythritol 4-phosphate cytidylyltransferase
MNMALIFAGGTGIRMNSRAKPKQFLELYGKPIILYTLEHFEKHPEIDGIVVVCLESWMTGLDNLIKKFDLLSLYGEKMQTVLNPPNNIKITAPTDFYILRALYEVIENE